MSLWNRFVCLQITVGPRFGGVIDDVARSIKDAYDRV